MIIFGQIRFVHFTYKPHCQYGQRVWLNRYRTGTNSGIRSTILCPQAPHANFGKGFLGLRFGVNIGQPAFCQPLDKLGDVMHLPIIITITELWPRPLLGRHEEFGKPATTEPCGDAAAAPADSRPPGPVTPNFVRKSNGLKPVA